MKDKIKLFHQNRDPYILIIGNQEAENRTISATARGNLKMNGIPLDEFVALCQSMNKEHSLELRIL